MLGYVAVLLVEGLTFFADVLLVWALHEAGLWLLYESSYCTQTAMQITQLLAADYEHIYSH